MSRILSDTLSGLSTCCHLAAKILRRVLQLDTLLPFGIFERVAMSASVTDEVSMKDTKAYEEEQIVASQHAKRATSSEAGCAQQGKEMPNTGSTLQGQIEKLRQEAIVDDWLTEMSRPAQSRKHVLTLVGPSRTGKIEYAHGLIPTVPPVQRTSDAK